MDHADIRTEPRWELLASAVTNRMTELDLSRRALATRAGISATVIGDIVTGKHKNYQSHTLAAVADALDWHPMAPMAVLAGDEAAPTVVIDLTARGPSHDVPIPAVAT